MIVESTQILCTVAQQKGQTLEEAPYRMSHGKHPCVAWCAASLANWKWLRDFTLALNDEYKYRYNKESDHKSAAIARLLKEPNMEDIGLTERPQCMPEQYKVAGDAAKGYRNYYIGEKQYFARWTKREPPKWYVDGCVEFNKLHPDTPTTPAQKKAIDLKLKKEKEKQKEARLKLASGKKAKKEKVVRPKKIVKEEEETNIKSKVKKVAIKKKAKREEEVEIIEISTVKMQTRSSKRKISEEEEILLSTSTKKRRASL